MPKIEATNFRKQRVRSLAWSIATRNSHKMNQLSYHDYRKQKHQQINLTVVVYWTYWALGEN